MAGTHTWISLGEDRRPFENELVNVWACDGITGSGGQFMARYTSYKVHGKVIDVFDPVGGVHTFKAGTVSHWCYRLESPYYSSGWKYTESL